MFDRPGSDDCHAYYFTYIDLVPDGDIVERLEAQVRDTIGWLSTVPEEFQTHRYAPGKWSVRECIGHVIDVERAFMMRAFGIARRDPQDFPGFDQEAYAAASNAHERPMWQLIDEFARVRASSVALVRSFDPSWGERRGMASGREFTVRSFPWMMAGHELHHMGVLRHRYAPAWIEAQGTRPGAGKDPRTQLRRRDRGEDDPWIKAFLGRSPVGVLSTVSEGQPFLNSNLFAYDADRHVVYMHTARTGLTRDNLLVPARVAFSAFEMGRLLPAQEALEFSVEYGGVVAFGTGRSVPDPEEARHGLALILQKYAPHLEAGRDYQGITEAELKRTAVFRIDIESWSGKQKAVAADFPGAYRYEEVTG